MKPLVRDIAAWLIDRVPGTASIQRSTDRLFIATFHRVLPESQLREYPLPGLAVTPSQFDWYIRFFSQNFSCVRLDRAWQEFLSGNPRPKPLLAITFDDGQLDNYLHAAPILKAYGVAGTFFIPVEALQTQRLLWHDRMAYAVMALMHDESNTSLLAEVGVQCLPSPEMPRAAVRYSKRWSHDQRLDWIRRAEQAVPNIVPNWDGLMSWNHLQELIRDGHEIGSHSFSHALLDQCDSRVLDVEVVQSRRILQEVLNQEVLSFCYPNGNADARVASAVADAGYQLAVTTHWGSNGSADAPFMLRRHDMVASNSMNRRDELSERRLRQRMLGYVRGAS